MRNDDFYYRNSVIGRKHGNRLIIDRIEAMGFRSLRQFIATYPNIHPRELGELIVFTHPYYRAYGGDFHQIVWDLSSIFHCEPEDLCPPDAEEPQWPEPSYNPHEDSDNRRTITQLMLLKANKSSRKLPRHMMKAFWMRYWRNKKLEEIGDEFDFTRERARQVTNIVWAFIKTSLAYTHLTRKDFYN